jgi:RNA polymerase sigma factor (sigma-70 family)
LCATPATHFSKKNRPADLSEEFDEKVHTDTAEQPGAEAALLQSADTRMLREALAELPVNFREVIVLRELEGMSYKEIAEVMGTPIGTVMSGLARGRAQLRDRLLRVHPQAHGKVPGDLPGDLPDKEEQRGLRK